MAAEEFVRIVRYSRLRRPSISPPRTSWSLNESSAFERSEVCSCFVEVHPATGRSRRETPDSVRV